MNSLSVHFIPPDESGPPYVIPDFGTIGGGSGNRIESGSHGTVAGGSSNSIVGWCRYYGGDKNSIGGGAHNLIGGAAASTIGGGQGNRVIGSYNMGVGYSTIGGGNSNTVLGTFDPTEAETIAGGVKNAIYYAGGAAIGGGSGNEILPYASGATIAGGLRNGVDWDADGAAIGGGAGNFVGGPNAVIAGGDHNRMFCDQGTIGGGRSNYVLGSSATIAGGVGNSIWEGKMDSIGGGGRNKMTNSSVCTIAGGHGNRITGSNGVSYSVIGGGLDNWIDASLDATSGATIGGGSFNTALASNTTVGGGTMNTVTNHDATIAGGNGNVTGSVGAAIGGGLTNAIISSVYGVVAGGRGNRLEGSEATGTLWPAHYSVISGGLDNIVATSFATIAGGCSNKIVIGYLYDNKYSTIGGGSQNRINSAARYATICGGSGNIAGQVGATVGGGIGNVSYSPTATIGGGQNNVIFGAAEAPAISPQATISGGLGNSVESYAPGATIGGGVGNLITGWEGGGTRGASHATVSGGSGNVVNVSYGTIPGGTQAKARSYGQMAYASGQFEQTGDAQTSLYVCRGPTTKGTRSELGGGAYIPDNATWSFDILVTGRTATGISAGYQIRGAVARNTGTTAFIGTPTVTVLGEDVASWSAEVMAVNDTLTVAVTGALDTTIRWVASVRTVEVIF